jgi:hypothetical protein
VIIDLQVNDPVIRQAAFIFQRHCLDPFFLKMIEQVPRFNHTKLSSKDVATELLGFQYLNLTIKTYSPIWRWSKAIAYADYSSGTIFFNSRINGHLADRVQTMWHESSHMIGMTHNGNRLTQYNLNTVPYLGASIFLKYLKMYSIIQ